MKLLTGKKKKRADPFANFFKAGCPGKGVKQANDVIPAGGSGSGIQPWAEGNKGMEKVIP